MTSTKQRFENILNARSWYEGLGREAEALDECEAQARAGLQELKE